MAFDGIVMHAVVHDLQDFIGGRVTKIYQPTVTDLIVHLRSRSRRGRLLISINAAFARLHLTQLLEGNPQEPPMFCMLLRKYLEGSVVDAISQPGFERVVNIDLRSRNDFGDLTEKRLIIELMGRHSNVILTDKASGRIIDSMKHLTKAVNRYRTVLPGETYVAPPDQGKMNPLEMMPEDLINRIQWNSGRIDRQIVGIVSGFSPLLGEELTFRAGLETEENIAEQFVNFQQILRTDRYRPNIISPENGKDECHVFELTHLKGKVQRFSDIHEMLDHFYVVKAESDAVRQKAGDLAHFITLELKKNKTKLKKLQQTVQEADQADSYRLSGELLTANLHRVKKGMHSITVKNYYDPQQAPATILLLPNRTPSENAQSYFKKYSKAKTARKVVREQIRETRQEIDYFEGLSQQIGTASLKDIGEIREELEEGGYLKKKRTKRLIHKKKKAPEIEAYYASDGTPILAGKNNKQNDYLTVRIAGKDQVWLHTKNIPGSHVVIRSDHPSEKTLFEAATLAAFYSKSRMGSGVPVDYTRVRYVRKPSGAKPGFVIYTDNKTLYVTPDEALILKMKNKPEIH